MHDIGKYNPAFQQYLRDAHAGREAKSTPHAAYGAVLAAEQGMPWLAPAIYGHHTGMPSQTDLKKAYEDPQILATYEVIKTAADGALSVSAPTQRVSKDLAGEMLLRMVFSCLVDSDYIDTERHFDPDRAASRIPGPRPVHLLPLLLADQERIMHSKTGTVNDVRREVYEHCLRASAEPPGVLRLSSPTGAGKTRSALAFGLSHAARHDMDRVIFAVPYLSITDQISQVTREILGPDAILEHHSGVLTREPSFTSKLAVQNWDAALIVTTTVQLLESLLSNRPSRCRKLHNISRSVIILDEVQTLPVRLLQPILSVLGELIRGYGCSIVLSTATQPTLAGQSKYLEGFDTVRDIVPPERVREHFQKLRRVRYEVSTEGWSWQRVAEELRRQDRAMAVVNTRRDAQELYDAVGEDDAWHLSASMCAAHRRDVLRIVRRKLEHDQPCLLVATQVVEAGVDLDFDAVLRAVGPLDRLVQAAGRCNREARLDEGRVVVFRAEEGTLPTGGEYRTGTYQAANILRRGADLHDPDIFHSYFTRLYQGVDRDEEGIQALRRDFDYPEGANRFGLIEEAHTDVIIQYDAHARVLVERIREEYAGPPDTFEKFAPKAQKVMDSVKWGRS